MMMFGNLIRLIITLLLLVYENEGSKCAPRDYGHGSVVCVCNVTYCDTLPSVPSSYCAPEGVVTVYSTSKDGDRFAVRELTESEKSSLSKLIDITIDQNVKYQKIIGFGGAFTDSAGINIAKLPTKMQHRLIRDYYDEAIGLDYSLSRVPMAGCDFSTRPYSYDDNAEDESLSKFALQQEDLKFKIPFIQQAKKIRADRPLRLFASPWSPPGWMKTNNKVDHGGKIKGQPGGKYYKSWAKYFVRFLQEYEKYNISFWGLTVENEPTVRVPWNSLDLTASLERDFLKLDLGPTLHQFNYTQDKLKVMVYDWNVFGMQTYVETVLNDTEARKFTSGIAFHWYETRNDSERLQLDHLQKKFPSQFLLATEACVITTPQLGNWKNLELYAEDIIKDLNHFSTGWNEWNLALDLRGGPNWRNDFTDAPIIINETSHEYYKQPVFYVMGHFSKFLLPDSVRLHQTVSLNGIENIMSTVFRRPDNRTVVIVFNGNDFPIKVNIHDPLTIKNFTIQLKSHSIQNLIWL